MKEKLPKMETIAETAKLTGLATYHVRQLVLNNKVKYIKTGKKYLLNFNSVIDYLNTGDNNYACEETQYNKIRKVG